MKKKLTNLKIDCLYGNPLNYIDSDDDDSDSDDEFIIKNNINSKYFNNKKYKKTIINNNNRYNNIKIKNISKIYLKINIQENIENIKKIEEIFNSFYNEIIYMNYYF